MILLQWYKELLLGAPTCNPCKSPHLVENRNQRKTHPKRSNEINRTVSEYCSVPVFPMLVLQLNKPWKLKDENWEKFAKISRHFSPISCKNFARISLWEIAGTTFLRFSSTQTHGDQGKPPIGAPHPVSDALDWALFFHGPCGGESPTPRTCMKMEAFSGKCPLGPACADCPGFLVLGSAPAPASTLVSDPHIVPLG